MNCKTCPTHDFVHADLYCRGCKDKQKPEIKTGMAYLLSKYGGNAIVSADVEAPAGAEYEMSAVELMSKFKIEFIGDL